MGVEKDIQDFLLGISRGRQIYFVGTTDKDSLSYHAGEVMTFKIRPKSKDGFVDVPYVKYTVDAEDGTQNEGFATKTDDGWFTFTASINRDGFVHAVAEACDRDKTPITGIDKFEGGAGADVDRITLGTVQPDDYFDFWNGLKQRVSEFEPQVVYQDSFTADEFPDYEFYDCRIKVSEDMNASFELSYPKGAAAGSLKLVMFFRGYGVAPLTPMAYPGCLCVNVNAHDLPNREPMSFYNEKGETELKWYGFDREQNQRPETTYWAKMYFRDLQIARFVKNHPLLNGKDFIMHGGSQGGMQSANMAAHCGFATECVMAAPWCADLYGTEVNGRRKAWRPECDDGMRYFDTAIAAQNLKCPVVIITGLGDTVCPPSGEMAMYNAIPTAKKLIFVQNRTHPYMPVEEIRYTLGDVGQNENFDVILKK